MVNCSAHVMRSVVAVSALIVFATPFSAQALMDIAGVDVYWLHDRTDGVAGGTPYGIEIDVNGFEIDSVEVIAPGGVGSFNLSPDGPGAFFIDLANSYGTFGALMADYPGHAVTPWVFNFTSANGAFDDDSFNVILNPTELTSFLDVQAPIHNQPITATPNVTWLDCSTCGGNMITTDLFDLVADTEVDSLATQTMTTTSWNPGGVIDTNNVHEIEAIIGDYSHLSGFFGNPQETTLGGDDFDFVAGYESINIIVATPEPGTGLLVGLGLVSFSVLGRRRD